jgi:hypothetical protein
MPRTKGAWRRRLGHPRPRSRENLPTLGTIALELTPPRAGEANTGDADGRLAIKSKLGGMYPERGSSQESEAWRLDGKTGETSGPPGACGGGGRLDAGEGRAVHRAAEGVGPKGGVGANHGHVRGLPGVGVGFGHPRGLPPPARSRGAPWAYRQ